MLIMSPFFSTRAGRARIAEDQRRIVHRRRADDQEVDIAAAVHDGGGRRGLQLIFLHAGLGARDHRLHRALAQHAGLAHAVEFLGAVDDDEVVQEVLGEHQFGVGQLLAQRVVLVDRQVIAMARVDLHQPDAAASPASVRAAARPSPGRTGRCGCGARPSPPPRPGGAPLRRGCRPSSRSWSARHRAAPARSSTARAIPNGRSAKSCRRRSSSGSGRPARSTASSLCSRILARSAA